MLLDYNRYNYICKSSNTVNRHFSQEFPVFLVLAFIPSCVIIRYQPWLHQ